MTNKVRGFTIDEIMTREGTSKRTTIHKKVKELQKYGYVDEAASQEQKHIILQKLEYRCYQRKD